MVGVKLLAAVKAALFGYSNGVPFPYNLTADPQPGFPSLEYLTPPP